MRELTNELIVLERKLNEKLRSFGWLISIVRGLPKTVEELRIRKSLMQKVIQEIEDNER
jgi:hypothetical protein